MSSKTNLTKIISGVAVALLLPIAAGIAMAQTMTTQTRAFTDVSTSSPYYTAIMYLKDHGVINGYSDGTFKPDQLVNRAEALKIILLGSGVTVPSSVNVNPFTDITMSAWFAPYVEKAKELQVVNGYADGTFKPAQTVNLVESLKILLLTQMVNVSAISVTANPYADAMMNQWYAPYIEYAKEKDLIDADSNNMVYPAQAMTRGKLAEVMYRLMYEQQVGTTQQPAQMTQQPTQEQTQQGTMQPTQQSTQQPTQQQTQEMACKYGISGDTPASLNYSVADTTSTSVPLIFSFGAKDQIDGKFIAAGDLWIVDQEVMLVTAYSAGTHTATVVRGFANTTAATHLDGAPVYDSSLGTLMSNISTPAGQLSTDNTITVQYNGLVPGDVVAVASGSNDIEYELLGSQISGTEYNVTRGYYGTTAINHPEFSMVIQFIPSCPLY